MLLQPQTLFSLMAIEYRTLDQTATILVFLSVQMFRFCHISRPFLGRRCCKLWTSYFGRSNGIVWVESDFIFIFVNYTCLLYWLDESDSCRYFIFITRNYSSKCNKLIGARGELLAVNNKTVVFLFGTLSLPLCQTGVEIS